jgi:hypothetical protein
MASENDRKKPAAENVEQQSGSAGSARKTPKAAARRPSRKAFNTFQPVTVGLLLQRIGYDEKGKPIPGIHRLFNSLTALFDSDDPVTLLLIEMLVTDYARMAKGLREEQLSRYGDSYLSMVIRYVNSSRRNLDSSLKMLRELAAERAEEEIFEEAPEWGMSEDDSPCPSLPQNELLRMDDDLMEDWPSTTTPSAGEAATPPPAAPTEQDPAAESATAAGENSNISVEPDSIPAATPPIDAAAVQQTASPVPSEPPAAVTAADAPQGEAPIAA